MRDLFLDNAAREKYLREMEAKVTKDVDLEQTTTDSQKEPAKVVILLGALYLRQTPDNPQERQKLMDRASNEVGNLISVKKITKLSAEGIKFEAGRRIPDIDLVGSIWH